MVPSRGAALHLRAGVGWKTVKSARGRYGFESLLQAVQSCSGNVVIHGIDFIARIDDPQVREIQFLESRAHRSVNRRRIGVFEFHTPQLPLCLEQEIQFAAGVLFYERCLPTLSGS
jgi:hypothetical protein